MDEELRLRDSAWQIRAMHHAKHGLPRIQCHKHINLAGKSHMLTGDSRARVVIAWKVPVVIIVACSAMGYHEHESLHRARDDGLPVTLVRLQGDTTPNVLLTKL